MSKSRSDQRRHRRRVAGTPAGYEEHRKRIARRGPDAAHEPEWAKRRPERVARGGWENLGPRHS